METGAGASRPSKRQHSVWLDALLMLARRTIVLHVNGVHHRRLAFYVAVRGWADVEPQDGSVQAIGHGHLTSQEWPSLQIEQAGHLAFEDRRTKCIRKTSGPFS
jgi:hypothetical protein